MSPLILVLNVGSSSIKFQLFLGLELKTVLKGIVENLNTEAAKLTYETNINRSSQNLPEANYSSALNQILILLEDLAFNDAKLIAIGHRVVHGGNFFQKPVFITAEVISIIERCSVLAPLHNPANLEGIKAAQKIWSTLPQIAVFDTAFHQSLPDYAYLYALPQEFYTQYAVRRYGFHGINYEFLSKKTSEILAISEKELKIICAHLGNGCSVCAIDGGKSVDTSMGFTPLAGVIMGTRSGDIDPGLFIYLQKETGMTLSEITDILNKKSGLLGISGYSADMRILQEAAAHNDDKANLAIKMFCYYLAKTIAAFIVPLGKIDALVFSGGIGENSALIRSKTLDLLKFLGFTINEKANAENGKNSAYRITESSGTCALVIAAQEELMIAETVLQLLEIKK